MSTASREMRKIPRIEQLFGYAYFGGTAKKGDPNSPYPCEICLRRGNEEIALTVQMSAVDLSGKSYQLLVGAAEAPCDPLLFSVLIEYFDGSSGTVKYSELTLFNKDAAELAETTICVLHAIMYSLFLCKSVTQIERHKYATVYYCFTTGFARLITDQSGVDTRNLIENLRLIALNPSI